jgi:hypothetical protein
MSIYGADDTLGDDRREVAGGVLLPSDYDK